MEKQIREIIEQVKPELGAGDISLDLNLDDAGFDSLDIATLLLAIQERYNITIADSDAETLTTIRAISAYVQQHDTLGKT